MELSKKQRKILVADVLDPPKILILEGSIRSGKTFLNNSIFYKTLRKYTGQLRNFIITGHTLGSVQRNVLLSLEEQFGIDCSLDNKGAFSAFGNRIHCFGTDKADSFKTMTGFTSCFWYGNEVTLSHPNSRQEALNRCSEEGSRIIWDCNPDFPEHPVKVNFINKSGERLSTDKLRIKSHHFELDDATFLDPEYVENLKKSTPKGMWYNRIILGQWVAAEGLVYEGWDSNVHIVEPFDIPDDWQRVRGIDWGYTNPFVMLWGALDHDGRLYIYKEYYVNKTLIKYLAKYINSILGRYLWTVADHDAQDNAEIGQYSIETKPAQKDVGIGLQAVAKRLIVQGDGKPRMFVFNNCPNTRREFGQYCWATKQEGKPAKEEPVDVNNHCLDTIRYMVMEIDNPSLFEIYPIETYPS